MRERKKKVNWIKTTVEHSSFRNTFPTGTEVKVVDTDDIRGFSIQDKNGRRIDEIGWII